MSRITATCLCGHIIHVEIEGTDEFECPECGRIFTRYFDQEIENYRVE